MHVKYLLSLTILISMLVNLKTYIYISFLFIK